MIWAENVYIWPETIAGLIDKNTYSILMDLQVNKARFVPPCQFNSPGSAHEYIGTA